MNYKVQARGAAHDGKNFLCSCGAADIFSVAYNGGDYLLIEANSKFDKSDESGNAMAEVCEKVLQYADGSGRIKIIFNVDSFAEEDCKSYTVSALIDGLSLSGSGADIILNVSLPDTTGLAAAFDEAEEKSVRDCGYLAEEEKFRKKFREFSGGLKPEQPFREYLLAKIEEKHFKKYSDFYKASGISKGTFSNTTTYSREVPSMPQKNTVAAMTIGLKLNIDEAEDFYNHAGYHLGTSDFVDMIIRFFISQQIYKIDEVNAMLVYYGYPTLGEKPRDKSTGK